MSIDHSSYIGIPLLDMFYKTRLSATGSDLADVHHLLRKAGQTQPSNLRLKPYPVAVAARGGHGKILETSNTYGCFTNTDGLLFQKFVRIHHPLASKMPPTTIGSIPEESILQSPEKTPPHVGGYWMMPGPTASQAGKALPWRAARCSMNFTRRLLCPILKCCPAKCSTILEKSPCDFSWSPNWKSGVAA